MTSDFRRSFNDTAGRFIQGGIGGYLFAVGMSVSPLAAFAIGAAAGFLIGNGITAARPVLPALASSFASACQRAYSRIAAEPAALRAEIKSSRPF